jgi:hypothetical protein
MFAPDRVTVALHPSRGLALVLGAAHGVGAAVPWLVALPVPMALAVTIGVGTLGALAIARDALRMWPTSVTGLELAGDGTGTLTLRSGRTESVRLGRNGTVVPAAVVLSLRGTRRYGVVVTRDACTEAEFRHLRVFLRWRLRDDPAGIGGR